MVIEKKYQLWKAASKDDHRPSISHIFVTHWPIKPADFIEPNHDEEFDGAPGAFLREDRSGIPCSCLECQYAHAKANRTPDSPFNQADIAIADFGVGVVYQTNDRKTCLAHPNKDRMGMRWYDNSKVKLAWHEASRTEDSTPAVDMAGDRQWSDISLEEHMNKEYGVAVATDGFCMVMIPVEIEMPDDLGLFDPRVLMQAHRFNRSKYIPITLRFGKKSNGDEYIKLSNGHLLPRWRYDTGKPTTSFPDYTGLIPPVRIGKGEVSHNVMTFDPRLFVRASSAIGIDKDKNNHARLTHAETRWGSPYMLEPISNKVDQYYRPPFCFIMPINDTKAEDWYKVLPFKNEEE